MCVAGSISGLVDEMSKLNGLSSNTLIVPVLNLAVELIKSVLFVFSKPSKAEFTSIAELVVTFNGSG